MNVLQTLGGFLQDCLQTNTAREIINNAWNIYYDYKRYRSLACLIMSLSLGAGGATLFVLEPSICGYFQSIVLQGLPFIGSTVAKIAVGIIGFWIGGGIGFNSAKYVSQQISERTLGHSNTAYTFTDSDLERIISNNPQIYQNKSNLISPEDVQQLRTYLEHVRTQIDNYSKSDPILHDRYKNALLKALQMSNLSPLLEIIGSNSVSQDIRKNITLQAAHYIGDVSAQFFKQKNKPDISKAKDSFSVKVQKSDEEESDDDPMPRVDLKKNIVVFSNLKRMTKEMNQQKNYPVKGHTSNKGGKQLSEKKQEALLHNLKHTYQTQHQTQQAEMILIPDKFKALLGMRRT